MRQVVLCVAVLVFAWASGLLAFIERVLLVVWPLAAFGVAVVMACGALALCIWFVGLAVRSLRSPVQAVEVIPPSSVFERSVRFAGGEVDYSHEWERELLVFAFIGNVSGFSLRSMLGHVSRLEWETLIGLLVGVGVLQSGKGGTRWGRGWSYGRLKAELRHGVLSLPYPAGCPPSVRWDTSQPARTAYTAHTAGTAREVSTGVFVG